MSAFSDRIRGQKKGFFKVADLEGGERTLTVDHLEEEAEAFGKVVDMLHFVEVQQTLQLNFTTAEWLLDHFGDDPEAWTGKRVTLFLGEYEYNKEKKLGIRLKLPGTATSKPAAAPETRARPT